MKSQKKRQKWSLLSQCNNKLLLLLFALIIGIKLVHEQFDIFSRVWGLIVRGDVGERGPYCQDCQYRNNYNRPNRDNGNNNVIHPQNPPKERYVDGLELV